MTFLSENDVRSNKALQSGTPLSAGVSLGAAVLCPRIDTGVKQLDCSVVAIHATTAAETVQDSSRTLLSVGREGRAW